MIHTASRSGTSVTSLEGLFVVTLAEIVGAGVDNNSALNMSRVVSKICPPRNITETGVSYANDAVGTNQLDKLVGDGALGIALTISLDVAEVTNVTGLIRGRTVSLVEGVDCRANLVSKEDPRLVSHTPAYQINSQ